MASRWTEKGLELFLLTAATFGVCCAMFLLDHESQGLGDVLAPSNGPAFLIYGAPILLLMWLQAVALRGGRLGLFLLAASAGAAALGGLVWSFASQAPTAWGSLRNFLLLTTLAGVLLSGSVLSARSLSLRLAGSS